MGNIINEGGINGTGKGVVNVNSQDYKELRKVIKEKVQDLDEKEKLKYGIISVRLQMESYVSDETMEEIIPLGQFLRKLLQLTKISNKGFAEFIGIQETNLSSIINGRRKINSELAYKLGCTFELNPNLWLAIQSKNELIEVEQLKSQHFKAFRLDNLLKKVS